MIFLDANFFIRFLAPAPSPEAKAMQDIATRLFEAITRGEEDATTTEVVLHEVAYILASKAHYQLPVPEIVSSLKMALQMPGLKLPRGDKKLYLRALDIYSAN